MVRPPVPPTDHWGALIYDGYALTFGSALFGVLGEGFTTCAVLALYGYWWHNHREEEIKRIAGFAVSKRSSEEHLR